MAQRYVLKASGGWKKKLLPLIVIIGIILAFVGYNKGWIKGRKTQKVEAVQLDAVTGEYKKEAPVNVPKLPLPSGTELEDKVFATYNTYDWHGNTAVAYANGGARTLSGSLIGQEGVNLRIVHQDDTNMSIKAFLEKAEEFKKSNGQSGGNLVFSIMGNASVALIEPMQAELKKIDPSFRAIGYDLVGKSDGEDQGIGPALWLSNPDAMRGKVIVGVWDDGDIYEVVMWVAKLGIPVNFDYHTYNPNALNIENVATFTQAGKVFLFTKELDPRPVVDDEGRRTGKTTKDLGITLKPDALASWTPVDRDVVEKLAQTDPDRLRGLATLVSTGKGAERSIMPTTVIALNKFVDANLDKLIKISYATHKAAMQIDAHEDAFRKAMEINSDLMGTWDGSDDATRIHSIFPQLASADMSSPAKHRYAAFRGYDAPENNKLRVGGSAVFSFRDAMNMLGMTDGGDDLENSTFASVYRSFGNLVMKKYPEKHLESYTAFKDFFDPRVLRGAYNRAKAEGIGGAELIAKREYKSDAQTPVIGSANFQVEFESGKATLTPQAIAVLQEIQDGYAASEYPITVVGHTDRTGTDAVNVPLSHERANAVRDFLVGRNQRDFGGNRITTDGKGSTQPPADVSPTYTGRCDRCRRVEIVIHR